MSAEPSNADVLAAIADLRGVVDAGLRDLDEKFKSLANLGYTHSRAIAGVQQKVDRGVERANSRFDLVTAEIGQVRADIVELKAEMALLEGSIGEVRDDIRRHADDPHPHGNAA